MIIRHSAVGRQVSEEDLDRTLRKKRLSWDIQKTLPDLPGEGSSLNALSPAIEHCYDQWPIMMVWPDKDGTTRWTLYRPVVGVCGSRHPPQMESM